jgi:predicted ATPase
MSFTLRVENLRALRKVEWAPRGVCALVGANGAGKSTLLLTLRFLSVSARRGIQEGFQQTFGSSYGLLNRHADVGDEIWVGLEIEGARWRVRLNSHGASIEWPAEEALDDERTEHSWHREEGAGTTTGGVQHVVGTATNLAVQLLGNDPSEPSKERSAEILSLLEGFRVYHDPDLWSLRMHGSSNAAETILHSRSTNAFAVLRMWNERREHRHRHRFVLQGLQAAFPHICSDLDFESAGQTTFARVWAPGNELPTPIANEANGLLAMLVYLCNIASSDPGGLVAIDEPENSLHPHALRELVDSAESWSNAHRTSIVFATHAPVILNELNNRPEQVWVMRDDAGDSPNPTRLDRLKNPDWLRHFTLGTLYANGELGSNDDAA